MVFNEKKQPPKRKASTTNESSVTIITPGCHFSGKLFCRGASRIGGRIEGEIVSEGMLVIEEEAIVTADIRAEDTVIQGTVQGKVTATNRVELSPTSRFEGDIFSPCLIIREGAQFNGRSTVIDPSVGAKVENIEALQKSAHKREATVPLRVGNGGAPEIGITN